MKGLNDKMIKQYFNNEIEKNMFEEQNKNLELTGEPNSDYFEEGFYYYH